MHVNPSHPSTVTDLNLYTESLTVQDLTNFYNRTLTVHTKPFQSLVILQFQSQYSFIYSTRTSQNKSLTIANNLSNHSLTERHNLDQSLINAVTPQKPLYHLLYSTIPQWGTLAGQNSLQIFVGSFFYSLRIK